MEDRGDSRGIRFTVGPSITGWHVGRAWSGHAIEDACPCQQEACWLVSAPDPACDQHNGARSTRQGHPAAACPGPPETRHETDAEKIVRLERQLKRARRKAARANEELFSTKISLQNMTGRAAWAERSAAWWKEDTTRDFYKRPRIVRQGPVEHVITVRIHGGEAPA